MHRESLSTHISTCIVNVSAWTNNKTTTSSNVSTKQMCYFCLECNSLNDLQAWVWFTRTVNAVSRNRFMVNPCIRGRCCGTFLIEAAPEVFGLIGKTTNEATTDYCSGVSFLWDAWGVCTKKEVLPLLDCSFGRSELHGRSFLHVDQNCTESSHPQMQIETMTMTVDTKKTQLSQCPAFQQLFKKHPKCSKILSGRCSGSIFGTLMAPKGSQAPFFDDLGCLW